MKKETLRQSTDGQAGYRIQGKIATSGHCNKYQGQCLLSGRPVIIKALAPEAVDRLGDADQCVINTLEAVTRLRHSGIAAINEYVLENGWLCVATEKMTGGDLRSRIDKGMSPAEVLSVLRQIAEALAYSHAFGVVHGNIKPKNILFDQYGNAKLSDFGTAGLFNPAEPHYISPEQLNGQEVDSRSDLYSLGVVFHEMLMGRPPAAVSSDGAEEPLQVIPLLPNQLAGFQYIVDGLLDASPANRYESAKQLIIEIDKKEDEKHLFASGRRLYNRKSLAAVFFLFIVIIASIYKFIESPIDYDPANLSQEDLFSDGGSPNIEDLQRIIADPAQAIPSDMFTLKFEGDQGMTETGHGGQYLNASEAMGIGEMVRGGKGVERGGGSEGMTSGHTDTGSHADSEQKNDDKRLIQSAAADTGESSNSITTSNTQRRQADVGPLNPKLQLKQTESTRAGSHQAFNDMAKLRQFSGTRTSLKKKVKSKSIRVDNTGVYTNFLGMRFRFIKPGKFVMGSPPHEPGGEPDETAHNVILSNGFWIQETEVTVSQWAAFIKKMGYKEVGERTNFLTGYELDEFYLESDWENPSFYQTGQHPVTSVSWDDIQVFIRWLKHKDGLTYRLPTEAEWEYAARAGTNTNTYWGSGMGSICKYANVSDKTAKSRYKRWIVQDCTDGWPHTAPVGSYAPNPWLLNDMIGNVWEWCQDWYGPYKTGLSVDPVGAPSGNFKVIRGGSWRSRARGCRPGFRYRGKPGDRQNDIGFRLIFSSH